MKEPAIAVQGPSKLQTLKRKVGYDEVNEVAEKRLAGNRSIQAMDAPTEEELVVGPGAPSQRHRDCVQTSMEVDNLC
jgi:hypothetical protein